jgi:hypothetical protein
MATPVENQLDTPEILTSTSGPSTAAIRALVECRTINVQFKTDWNALTLEDLKKSDIRSLDRNSLRLLAQRYELVDISGDLSVHIAHFFKEGDLEDQATMDYMDEAAMVFVRSGRMLREKGIDSGDVEEEKVDDMVQMTCHYDRSEIEIRSGRLQVGLLKQSQRKPGTYWRRRLLISTSDNRSNEIAKSKAVNLQRPTNRDNQTSKKTAFLQRPISPAYMLPLAVYSGIIF